MQQQLRAQAGYEISPKMQADPALKHFIVGQMLIQQYLSVYSTHTRQIEKI